MTNEERNAMVSTAVQDTLRLKSGLLSVLGELEDNYSTYGDVDYDIEQCIDELSCIIGDLESWQIRNRIASLTTEIIQ